MLNKFTIIITFIVLSGCAILIDTKTEYKEWRGNKIYQGKGGAVETVQNLEFWEHGEPNKPYKIIGVITQSKKTGTSNEFLFGNFNQGEIIEIIQNNNGDGVITLSNQKYISGYSTSAPINEYAPATTSAEYSNKSILSVFKYVNSNKKVKRDAKKRRAP